MGAERGGRGSERTGPRRGAPRKRITTQRDDQAGRAERAEDARRLFELYTCSWPDEHHHLIRGHIAEELHVAYSTVVGYLNDDAMRRAIRTRIGRRARGAAWSGGDILAARLYWMRIHGSAPRPIDWNLAELRRLKGPQRRARIRAYLEGWVDSDGERRPYPNAKTVWDRRRSGRRRGPRR